MSSGRKAHWNQVYQDKGGETVSAYQAEPAPSRSALERFGARPTHAFIDVGGGASLLVDCLLDRGWSDLNRFRSQQLRPHKIEIASVQWVDFGPKHEPLSRIGSSGDVIRSSGAVFD